jgi:hypothetical protein
MLCSLLFQASILARYWVEGLHTTTYLLNRLPTKAISTTSPYFALHGVAPSYEHLRVFGCAYYPNLSAKVAHKLAPQSTRCIFLGYSADHKGYQCLDLTTNNIIVSPHVVFDEVDFSFSASPRLTNDLDILLQDDSSGVAPIPAPLSTPHVPLGFSPLIAAGGQTLSPGGQTARGIETGGSTVSPGGQTTRRTGAGGPTVSPGGQTAHGTGAGGSTASPGGQTAHGTGVGSPTTRPYAAPPSSASLTSTVSRAPPSTSAAPHAAPTTPAASPGAPTSQLYPTALLASFSGYAGATGTASTSAVATSKGCTGGPSGQPSFDDHTGETGLPASGR